MAFGRGGMPYLALILFLVALGLVLLFCACVKFTVHCFSPENTRGPLWSTTKQGESQYVDRPHSEPWLAKLTEGRDPTVFRPAEP